MTPARVLVAAAVVTGAPTYVAASARADDGVYGRLDGDLTLSGEVGISEMVGDDAVAGESLAARVGAFYLQSVGLYGQYNDSLGVDALPIARSVSGGVELRPLFLGRWARAMETGPAHFDLWLDSIGLGLGAYGRWWRERHCIGDACPDHGMEASLGMELPLFGRTSTPFIALRGTLRWSLREATPDARTPSGMLSLTIGYHHLFETHIVDAGDALPR